MFSSDVAHCSAVQDQDCGDLHGTSKLLDELLPLALLASELWNLNISSDVTITPMMLFGVDVYFEMVNVDKV